MRLEDTPVDTPRKINMEPKNGGLEDDFPFQAGDFRFHINFPGCTPWKIIMET